MALTDFADKPCGVKRGVESFLAEGEAHSAPMFDLGFLSRMSDGKLEGSRLADVESTSVGESSVFQRDMVDRGTCNW